MQNNNANTSQEIPRSEQIRSRRPIIAGRIIGIDEVNRHNGHGLIKRLRRGLDLENETQLFCVASTILSLGLIGMGSLRMQNTRNDDDRQLNNTMQTIQIIGVSALALSLSCGIYIYRSILNSDNSINDQEIQIASRLRFVVNPDDSMILGSDTRPRGDLETLQNQEASHQQV